LLEAAAVALESLPGQAMPAPENLRRQCRRLFRPALAAGRRGRRPARPRTLENRRRRHRAARNRSRARAAAEARYEDKSIRAGAASVAGRGRHVHCARAKSSSTKSPAARAVMATMRYALAREYEK